MNKIKVKSKQWILLIVLTIMALGGWGTIFLFNGRPKIIAWWFIHIISVMGIISVVALCILMIKDIYQHKKVKLSKGITLIMAIIIAWPAGWFFEFAKVPYPTNVKLVEPAVTIALPMLETTIVGWGGDKLETNYPHIVVPVERWAYDLLMEPASMGSKHLEDYGIYGKEVIAPVSGTIIGVKDSEEDITPGSSNEPETMVGNHIYIQIEETGTYLVLAHFKKDSILVEVGQHVNKGTIIGKVGNTGSSSEPHLHIHHQRENPLTTHLLLSEGLPLYFESNEGPIMPSGGVRVEDGRDILIGDRISPMKKRHN